MAARKHAARPTAMPMPMSTRVRTPSHPVLRPAILAAALSLCSCAAPLVSRQVPFHEADFAWAGRTGSGSVSGQVFVTMTDHTMKIGSNVTLVLLPVNAYTTESIQRKYLGGENLADGDPRYDKYVHAAQADDQGYFAFHQIPPGDYFVGTNVVWSYWIWNTDGEGVMYKITITRRTRIFTRVSVHNGQTIRVTDWVQCKSQLL